MGDDDDDGPVVFKRNITSSKNHQLKSALMNASSHRHDGASSRHATNNGDADDDDDEPLVFRRNNTASKEKLLNSAAMKSPPHKHDASSGKRVSDAIMKSPPHKHDTSSGKHASDARASDRQNSDSLKGKVVLSGKALTENRSVASPKTSTSTAEKSKNSSERNLVTGIMEKKSLKAPAESDADSDDDKPLSARVSSFTVTVKKSNASHVSKEHIISEKGVSSIKKSCDDSEDEKPLSSKFSSKSGGAGASVKSSHDSDDDKPLSLKLKQNGSGKGDPNCKQPSKSSISNKRPSSEVRSPPPSSSVKKPKLLAGSVPNKIKAEHEVKKEAKMDVPNKIKVEKEVKKEAKMDDDDDHIPISQRVKKSEPPLVHLKAIDMVMFIKKTALPLAFRSFTTFSRCNAALELLKVCTNVLEEVEKSFVSQIQDWCHGSLCWKNKLQSNNRVDEYVWQDVTLLKATLLETRAKLLLRGGHFDSGEELCRTCISIRTVMLGHNHAQTLAAQETLAKLAVAVATQQNSVKEVAESCTHPKESFHHSKGRAVSYASNPIGIGIELLSVLL